MCSDNPTPLWSDYPTSALGLSDVEECASDYGSEHPLEKLFSRAPNFLHVRLIRCHQVDTSEQASDHSPERVCFQAGIFSSESDDPTHGSWIVGLMSSSNDQTVCFGIQIQTAASDDPTVHSKGIGLKSQTNDISKCLKYNGYCGILSGVG